MSRSVALAARHICLSILVSIIHVHKTIGAPTKPDMDSELSRQRYPNIMLSSPTATTVRKMILGQMLPYLDTNLEQHLPVSISPPPASSGYTPPLYTSPSCKDSYTPIPLGELKNY